MATRQSKGGEERAKRLSPDVRKDIATRAAQARWAKPVSDPNRLPVATHQAPLQIGTVLVDAYRLNDGRRMMSKAAMAAALGLKSTGGNAFLRSMTRPAVRQGISEEVWESIEKPQHFHPAPTDLAPQGLIIHGYEGAVLIDVCEVLIDAGRAGRLNKSQEFSCEERRDYRSIRCQARHNRSYRRSGWICRQGKRRIPSAISAIRERRVDTMGTRVSRQVC